MTALEISEKILTCGIVPAVGIYMFMRLLSAMKLETVSEQPKLEFFILYAVVTGWITVLLSAILQGWQGFASAGSMILTLAGPWITAWSAFRLNSVRKASRYHTTAFWCSAGYSAIILILMHILVVRYLMKGQGAD